MEMIGAVDLSGYVQTPDLTAKVQPASEFLSLVKREFEPEREDRPRSPSMLLGSMRGLQFRPGEVTVWGGLQRAPEVNAHEPGRA